MSKSGVSVNCRPSWEGMRFREKGKDSEADGRGEGKENEAVGRAGLGLGHILGCI